MIRKEFVLTEKQIKVIRERSKKTGLSQNEILRRIIDRSFECEKNHGSN